MYSCHPQDSQKPMLEKLAPPQWRAHNSSGCGGNRPLAQGKQAHTTCVVAFGACHQDLRYNLVRIEAYSHSTNHC